MDYQFWSPWERLPSKGFQISPKSPQLNSVLKYIIHFEGFGIVKHSERYQISQLISRQNIDFLIHFILCLDSTEAQQRWRTCSHRQNNIPHPFKFLEVCITYASLEDSSDEESDEESDENDSDTDSESDYNTESDFSDDYTSSEE